MRGRCECTAGVRVNGFVRSGVKSVSLVSFAVFPALVDRILILRDLPENAYL